MTRPERTRRAERAPIRGAEIWVDREGSGMREFEHAAESRVVQAGDTVENAVTGERLTFLATSRETDGAYTRVRFTLPPRGAGTRPHLHTTLSERFEVVSGRLTVSLGGEPPFELAPGESASVPPYTVHRFWNGADEGTIFEAEVRPSGGFEAFMLASFGLARDGRTGRVGVPLHPLDLGLLMQHADVYLPGLPVPAQKAVFAALASAARRLGYEMRFRRYADHGGREDGTGGAADATNLTVFKHAYGVASRKLDERARGLAAVVGWVSLGMGLALTLAPRSSATALGWGDRARLARVAGVADLIIGPALLLDRRRAPWMLYRTLLNAALSGVYAWTLVNGTPRRDRALGGMVGMSVLTVTDGFLARRLRNIERTGPEPGE